MTCKTYTTKANAKRALKSALAKINLELNSDICYDIQAQADGSFLNIVDFSEDEIPEGVETLFDIAQVEGLIDVEKFIAKEDEMEEELVAEGELEDMGEAMTADEDAALEAMADEEMPAPRAKRGYIRERSDHGGVCSEVWAIADSMPNAKRKDVISACRDQGIAYGTARTQYQKWKNRAAV